MNYVGKPTLEVPKKNVVFDNSRKFSGATDFFAGTSRLNYDYTESFDIDCEFGKLKEKAEGLGKSSEGSLGQSKVSPLPEESKFI